ncbi:hypothetical protein QQS21_004617 [Conoideocrella luteorostrata]|uniref:Uncharacterized protein n=1 Tax=Conoideocrella luteorostrata TaxID=1105319 RepID=A0AAJ0CS09_9HYPO|nr:hypothetical protein QQS21_004617 [Conoideocrella luteorostrata]
MRGFTSAGTLPSLFAFPFFALQSILLAPVSARPPRHSLYASSDNPDPQILTGLYGTATTGAQIVIHDTSGKPSWTWSFQEGKNISADLQKCLYDVCKGSGCGAPENKWAHRGDSVLAIHGYAAVIINHHPGQDSDKAVTFGICLNRDDMDNSHTVELVGDGKLAVATTTDEMTGSIKIFDIHNTKGPLDPPIQQLDGIPATHALVWDAHNSVLWAAGNDRSPIQDGSTSILNAYTHQQDGSFDTTPETQTITTAARLTTEWGSDTPWWDGPHAMAPVPQQRKLLITTDMDVHVYDMDAKTFEHGAPVAQDYMPGFQPVGARTGPDGVDLPRSDIKSVSYSESGQLLYVQAEWNETYGDTVNFITNGQKGTNIWNQMLYRSRWFTRPAW